VRIRCGAPLRFATVREPSPPLAAAVTERVWARVALQWEWLGGDSPLAAPPRRPPWARSLSVEREARAA
jgi:hypothetical protein